MADSTLTNLVEAGVNDVTTQWEILVQNPADNNGSAKRYKLVNLLTLLGVINKADLVGGKVSTAQIPDIAISAFLGNVASQAEMLALVGQKGDWVNRTDVGKVYMISGDNPAQLASWTELIYPANAGVAAGNVEITVNQANHGFTVGTILRRVGATYLLSQGVAAGNAYATDWIVSEVVNTGTFKAKPPGSTVTITGATLTQNAFYYLNAEAGLPNYVLVPPDAVGEVERIVFRALSATEVFFNPGPPFELAASAKVLLSEIEDMATGLLGNPTGSLGAPRRILIGTGLSFDAGTGTLNATASGGGASDVVKIATGSIVDGSGFTFDFDPYFATYDEFEIHIHDLIPANDYRAIHVLLSSDGTTFVTGADTYNWSGSIGRNGGRGPDLNSAAAETTYILIGENMSNSPAHAAKYVIRVQGPNNAALKASVDVTGGHLDRDGRQQKTGVYGGRTAAGILRAIRVKTDNDSNFSLKYKVIGIKP